MAKTTLKKGRGDERERNFTKCFKVFVRDYSIPPWRQGHPEDRFGGISARKTCNRLKFSVREMSSRAFSINAFCFRRDKNDVLGTKIGQLGFSERQ